jgi:hypothetical protein
VPWHAHRAPVVEVGAALGMTAGVAGKITLDVVLLAQTEVSEVTEGAGWVGLSMVTWSLLLLAMGSGWCGMSGGAAWPAADARVWAGQPVRRPAGRCLARRWTAVELSTVE